MKTLVTLLSATVLLTTAGFAETPVKTKAAKQVQNESQNRFKNMSTDELLQKRGTLTSQQEREQLHSELTNRQQKMTKEQQEKFSRAPEKTPQGMGKQGKGMGYGQGQGDVQGLHKGQDGGMGGTRVPEKTSQEMGQQGKGMGYGQGQGDTQGLNKGQMDQEMMQGQKKTTGGKKMMDGKKGK